jgi:hypothetical protein
VPSAIRALAWFNLDYATFFAHLQVLWAIGASMIALSLLVRLPVVAVAAIGALLIVGHNVLDAVQVPSWRPDGSAPAPGFGGAIWMLLHTSRASSPSAVREGLSSGPTIHSCPGWGCCASATRWRASTRGRASRAVAP